MLVASLAVLAVYSMVAIAVLALRRKDVRAEREPLRLPGGPLVPVVTCVLIAWVVTQTATRKELAAFGLVWLLSLVLYAQRRRRAVAHSEGTT
jgi:L-asparagine transporter-like permease